MKMCCVGPPDTLLRPLKIVWKWAVLLVCVGCASVASAQSEHMSGAGRDIRMVKIANGVYQFTTIRDSYVRQLNSVVIVNERDVLVFDTNTRPSSARLILAEIRKLTDKPVRFVVNSHWHPDHWSGNGVYAEAFPGLDIIATEETLQFMQAASPAWNARFTTSLAKARAALASAISTGKQPDGTALSPQQRAYDEEDVADYQSLVDEQLKLVRVLPNLTYSGQLTLRHGGREFRLLSVTGDAEGSTVLYLPREKILITGDAVSYPIPYVTPPPTRQLKSLQSLALLDADTIIPGHGPAFHDKQFLLLETELLERIIKGVREALAKGVPTLEAIQQAVTVDDLRERFAHGDKDLEDRFRDRVKIIVKLAVREARDGQDYQ